MGIVITLGLQKGGVSKSTTTGILAHLMSEDGKKVLAVDMDSQGNLTEFLTDTPANEFIGKSVFEAIVTKDVESYIYKVNDNLSVLPSNNFLALFSRWLYTRVYYDNNKKVSYDGKLFEQLDKTLEPIRDKYDYILIDTPPSLSEQTSNALCASDYVIVMYECSKFCYTAIPNFMDSVVSAQDVSRHEVKPIGLLRTLNDKRRSDFRLFNEKIGEEYPDLVFDTIITRKATVGRLPFYGFQDNPELPDALSQFKSVYQELKERLGEK